MHFGIIIIIVRPNDVDGKLEELKPCVGLRFDRDA